MTKWTIPEPADALETIRQLRARIDELTADLEAAERSLADWRASQHYSYIDRSGKRVLARDLEARAEAAQATIARLTAELEAARGGISEPYEPGGFVGDIYYGHPVKTTFGTHRWNGAEWKKLPSEAEVLAELLADARKQRDADLAGMKALLARAYEAARDDAAAYHVDAAEDEKVLSKGYRGGSDPWFAHVSQAKRHLKDADAIRALTPPADLAARLGAGK